MLIKDRMEYKQKGRPFTLTPDTLVKDAVSEMSTRSYGAVIVINDDDTPAGIVTERDFMVRLLNRGLDQNETKLKDIMTSDIYVAQEDDNLVDWLRQMSNERFRHLPVVDKNGKVLCMMSQGDFVSYTWPELMEQIKNTAKASIIPNYQIAIIVIAVILYAIVVPVLYNLFN